MNIIARIKRISFPLRISLIYLTTSLLWIIFSDQIANALFQDGATLSLVQTVKGFAFVSANAIVLYVVIFNYVNQIQRTEAKYRLLFRSNPHPMWTYDPQTLAFTSINDAAVRQYGYSHEEFLSMTIKDIRPPETIPALLKGIAARTDEPKVWTHRKKNGELIDVEIHSTTIPLDKSDLRLILSLDVTETQEIRRKLLEAEERYRTLINTSPDAIFVYTDAAIRFANPAGTKMFGVREEDIINLSLTDLEQVIGNVPDLMRQALETDETYIGLEHRFRLPDGQVFDVEFSDVPIIFDSEKARLTIVRDIARRKQSEKDLRESEGRFRSLVEANIAGTYILVDGVVKYANPALLEIFGHEADEVIDQLGPLDFVHPSDRERVIHVMQGRVEDEEDKSHYTFKGVDKSGNIKEVEVFGGTTIYNGKSALIGTMIDITQRRKAERELEQSEANLRAIFDNALQAFFLFDQDKQILAVNKVAEQWMQAVMGEPVVLGEVANDLWDSIDLTIFDKAFIQALNGRPYSYDYHLNLGSHNRWFEVYANPVMEGDTITGVALSILDITERKISERTQDILTKANASLTESLNLDFIFEKLLAYASDLVPFDTGSILLIDQVDQLKIYAGRGPNGTDQFIGSTINLSDFPEAQELLLTQKSIVVDDTTALPHWDKPLFAHFRNWLGIPLIAGGEVSGIYSFEKKQPNYFTAIHANLLELLATHAAVAIKNAQLYKQIENYAQGLERRVTERTSELQRQYQWRDGLAKIELAINEEHELQLMMDKTVDIVRDLLGASIGCSLVLWDKELEKFDISSTNVPRQPSRNTAVRVRRSGGASRWVIDNHKPLVVPDTKNDPFGANPMINEYGIRAYMGVPVNFNNITSGVLYVLDNHTREYQQDEIDLLQQFAHRVAVAINRVQLYKQLQKTNQNLQELSDALAVRIERTITIVNSNSNGIVLLSIENGIQEVNLAFQTLTKSSQSTCIGKPLSDFVCPEDQEILERAIKDAREKVIQNIELCMKRLDSTTFDAELSFAPVAQLASENIQLVCTIQDISERKRVEKELRQRDNWYRTLASHLPNTTVMLFDQDYRYLIIENSEPYFTKQEVEGKTVQELLPPDSFEELFPIYEATLRGEYNQVERRQHGRIFMGEYVPIADEDGQITSGLLFSRDITDQRLQEHILKENEERLRILFDSLPDGIILSTPDGILHDLNPALLNMVGYTRDQLVGQNMFDLLPHFGIDITPTQNNFERLLQGLPNNVEYSVKIANGQTLWLQFITHSITIRDQPYFLSLVRNITDRKQMETALHESEQMLLNVIDNIPIRIFWKDRDSVYQGCNTLHAQHLGLESRDLFVGLTDYDFVPEQASAWHAADSKVIETGEGILNIEEFVNNPFDKNSWMNFSKVPLRNASGEINGILVTVEDITIRKQAEEALRISEERYRKLIETMREGLAIYDIDDKITYVNDHFCTLLGYSRDELIGTYPYEYVDDDNTQILQSQLEQRQALESSAYDVIAQHKDGSTVHLLVSASPLVDENGDYNGSFAVLTDITIQKLTEEALRRALEKEKELGELKTRFVSMASHEFRTPLASIHALSETLSVYRDKLSDEQIDIRLEKIRNHIHYLTKIMEDVLQLARIQESTVAFNPVAINIDKLCRSVLDEFELLGVDSHRLDYANDGVWPETQLDGKLMRQIITNLVSNAIKYSAEDSTVMIRLQRSNNMITLSVKDKGVGIPEEDMKHLFKPFHRASNVGTIAGTGLGLVITKEAVELHGGTIRVTSQVGSGTTFTVEIPFISSGGAFDDENSDN